MDRIEERHAERRALVGAVMANVNQRRHDRHDGHEWHDAMLGAESLRPTRQGDDLQAGSNWTAPAPRQHYTPASDWEQKELRRFGVYIALLLVLIGLAGGLTGCGGGEPEDHFEPALSPAQPTVKPMPAVRADGGAL